MGRKKNGTGSGRVPDGQLSRGTPTFESSNPKNNQARRPDVIGRVPGEGDAVLRSDLKTQTSTNYEGAESRSAARKGDPSSVPDGRQINTAYSEIVTVNVPSTSNPGANRQRFGIDPGDVVQPNGDTTEGPRKPSYGVGTTGE